MTVYLNCIDSGWATKRRKRATTQVLLLRPCFSGAFAAGEIVLAIYSSISRGALKLGLVFFRLFCSYFWGYMSDRLGRKPVMLVSLSLLMLSNILYGFAVNLAMAMGFRFFGGLVNGEAML